jgi:hypothetical protein
MRVVGCRHGLTSNAVLDRVNLIRLSFSHKWRFSGRRR